MMCAWRGRLGALSLVALLGACAATPPREAVPEAPLQPGAGAADPTRQAVLSAAYGFADPSRLAGRPGDAARAASQLEWLAVALPANSRWIPASPGLFPRLIDARSALRESVGIAPSAPATATVPALTAAGLAMDAGDRAAAITALAPVAPGGGEAMLGRLQSLPPQPRAAAATWLAQEEMLRMDQYDPE